MTGKRRGLPGQQESNQELFVWALYLLGGADNEVDVEDIYMKCFEIAQARFGWRTRPEIPDYKKTSKALQSVEAQTDFIHKTHPYLRRLTRQGVEWVETNHKALEARYDQVTVPPPRSNEYSRLRSRLKKHAIWKAFINHETENQIFSLAEALSCAPSSPESVWKSRLTDLEHASKLLSDDELLRFKSYATEVFYNARGNQ